MAKRSKKPRDINALPYAIVDEATSDKEPQEDDKNPHAVALGRLGGLKGGKARAEKLSAAERRAIGRKAASARWQGKRKADR